MTTENLVIIDEGANLYYIRHNGHSVFVKGVALFFKQGGETKEWVKAWKAVWAKSIEEAWGMWS